MEVNAEARRADAAPAVPDNRARMANLLTLRYKRYYAAQAKLTSLATVVEVAGGIYGLCWFAVALSAAAPGNGLGAAVVILLAIWMATFIWSVILRAISAFFQAYLDNSVASSPVLTDEQRAEAMGLW